MKVMCINGAKKGQKTLGGLPLPKRLEIYENQIYFVVGETEVFGNELYLLQGFPKNFGYRKSRFIPLSDIDEKELIKERELVNA